MVTLRAEIADEVYVQQKDSCVKLADSYGIADKINGN